MKRWIKFIFLGVSISLGGCLNTFYPIYNPKDLVWNENLIGYWQFENERMQIAKITDKDLLPKQLQQLQDKIMLIRNMNDGNDRSADDIAMLVKIGNHYFLDRFPVLNDAEKKLNPLFTGLFLRQHSIYRVDSFQTGNKLFLQRVSDTKLKEQIEQKRIKIQTIQRDDASLILATTEELQKHIIKYADDQGLYENDNSHTFRKIEKK
jgi:hypothetical protein